MEMIRRPLALSLEENRKALAKAKYYKDNEHELRAKERIEPVGEGNRHTRRREAAIRRKERV